MKRRFRHLKIFISCLRLNIIREMQYKVNFVLWFFVMIVDFLIFLFFYENIYTHVNQIAGWNKYEWFFYLGFYQVFMAIYTSLFLIGIGEELPNYINTGNFDYILLKPVNSQFFISVSMFRLGYFCNIIPGLLLIIYSMQYISVDITFIQILAVFLYTTCGFIILYSILFVAITTSIWLIRVNFFLQLFLILYDFMRNPYSIYHRIFQVLFFYIIPILLVCSTPVGILLDKVTLEMLIITPVIALLWLCLAGGLWKFALKRYTSASS